MAETTQFLIDHGVPIVFIAVLLEQLGLPLPAVPWLLAAGALYSTRPFDLLAVIGVSLIACLIADALWFYLGQRRGNQVLGFLCRVSLEPDSCVRRTQGIFQKQGAKSLLVAKFVPGLSAVATPLAGIFQMEVRKFLAFDALGALLWSGTYLGLGYVFSDQLERVALKVEQFGGGVMALVVALLICYVMYKFIARQRFLRQLRIGRITPAELKEKLDAGEALTIVDLRHALDFEADPETIPGAFRMDARDLEQQDKRLPRDREIILYCT